MPVITKPVRVCLLALLLLAVATPAFPQSGAGVVAGVSGSPNQFYIGGHVKAGTVAKDFRFRPGLEVGFGNGSTLVALNGDFVYSINLRKSSWTPYVGGGPAIIVQSFRKSGAHHTDAGPGFNFLAGVGKSRGVYAEIKAGLLDSPGFKFGIGYTFR